MTTSELAWLETLTKPLRDDNPKLAGLFRAPLLPDEVERVSRWQSKASGVVSRLSHRSRTLLPVTRSVSGQAARLCALGLKTPDALHAATALAYQCTLFITNDPIFHPVPNLPVVVLAGAFQSTDKSASPFPLLPTLPRRNDRLCQRRQIVEQGRTAMASKAA